MAEHRARLGAPEPKARLSAGRRSLVEEVRSDDPDLAGYLRTEEREFDVGGLN